MDDVAFSNRFLRQSEIANPKNFKHPIFILGLGSIGSAGAIALAKMGTPKGMTFVDYDTFEDHNIPNQLCLEKAHKGMSKVEAISSLCQEMGNIGPIQSIKRKLLGSTLVDITTAHELPLREFLRGIVISTPDSMEARKDLWKSCLFNPQVERVIDVRVAGMGQYIEVHTAKPMLSADSKRYLETLYDDSAASTDPCGARGVIFTTLFAGGLIASLVRKIQLGMKIPVKITFDTSSFEVQHTFEDGSFSSNREALSLAMAE